MMKTIIALLMMTSVAGAQIECYQGAPCSWSNGKPTVFYDKTMSGAVTCPDTGHPCPVGPGTCANNLNACLRMLGGAFPVPDKPIDCQQTIIECMKAQLRTQNDPTYTLVLRDKRGVTMLIRGIIPRVVGVTFNGATNTPTDAQGNPITQSCERFAADLKVSPDIESAECFK